MGRYAGLVLVVLLAACGGPRRVHYPDFVGRELYTCCNLRFDLGRYASDANYDYSSYKEGSMLPAGTRVRIVDDEDGMLRFEPQGVVDKFRLAFKFGKSRMSAEEWFRLILVEEDPRNAFRAWPAPVVQAVSSGQLAVGLTKEQAIVARGYPPFHRTAGVEADEWLYYASPGFVERVRFAGGRLASVDREDAPK